MLKGIYRFYSNICLRPGNIFFREGLAYFSKTMLQHPAFVTTAWLRNRRVHVLNWPACSPDLPPKHLVDHEMKNMAKKTQDRSAARIVYQTQRGQHFSLTTPAAGLLSSQTDTDCC